MMDDKGVDWRFHPKGGGLISVNTNISWVRGMTPQEEKDWKNGKLKMGEYGQSICKKCGEYDYFWNKKDNKGIWRFTCSQCGHFKK